MIFGTLLNTKLDSTKAMAARLDLASFTNGVRIGSSVEDEPSPWRASVRVVNHQIGLPVV